MPKKPYTDKELHEVYKYAVRGLKLMKRVKRDDPVFDDYLVRFFDLLEYFFNRMDPIEDMRMILDKKYVEEEKLI